MRIVLPDVPGSLGVVASAIGRAGANIEALEILEHNPEGRAVDDVFVEVPHGVMPDAVVSQINEVDGAQVLWISRYPASGNFHLDLEAVELLTERPTDVVQRLVDVVPATFRCDWSMVLHLSDGRLRATAATESAPTEVDGCRDWFPATEAIRVDVEADDWPGWGTTVVGAVPLGGEDRMVVFGRRGGPEILRSELVRLDYIASLAVSVEQATR